LAVQFGIIDDPCNARTIAIVVAIEVDPPGGDANRTVIPDLVVRINPFMAGNRVRGGISPTVMMIVDDRNIGPILIVIIRPIPITEGTPANVTVVTGPGNPAR
jgi:hypothetical protein